jgi:cell shape-determining protein MreD
MKTFIVALIIAALFQTSFLPISLVLLLLISRSLILSEKSNLYLGFFFGLLIGVLSSINAGFYSLFFLIIIELVSLIKKTPFTANFLLIIPIAFASLLFLALGQRLFLGETINFWPILLGTILSVPIYLIVRFWEERFVVAPPVKLKL